MFSNRGGCSHQEKALVAQAAGAVALVIVNTDARDKRVEFVRGPGKAGADAVMMPVFGIGYADGVALKKVLNLQLQSEAASEAPLQCRAADEPRQARCSIEVHAAPTS